VLLAVQSLAPCVLLRHLADRAVQACLFKLVPRGCCIIPAAARREGVYHSVHGFFDCALTVDVYNICHGAQLAGLGLERLIRSIRLGLARQLAALSVQALRPGLFLRVALVRPGLFLHVSRHLWRSGYNAGHLSRSGCNAGHARSATGS
jgi:hypothetical protein